MHGALCRGARSPSLSFPPPPDCCLQPSTEADLRTALELLKGEIAQHADLIIVPGESTAVGAQHALAGMRRTNPKSPALMLQQARQMALCGWPSDTLPLMPDPSAVPAALCRPGPVPHAAGQDAAAAQVCAVL